LLGGYLLAGWDKAKNLGTILDVWLAHILAQTQNYRALAASGFKWLDVLESGPNGALAQRSLRWHNFGKP
jgi:hypothetical protein